MRHPYFNKAIMEAYEKILAPESFPSYFIFLEADPATIDVNIHPTKTEIKFENERMIWQIIYASAREAIGKFNIAPSIDFNNEGVIDIPLADNNMHGAPDIQIDRSFNPFREDDQYQRDPVTINHGNRSNRSTGNRQYPAFALALALCYWQYANGLSKTCYKSIVRDF